MNDLLPLLGQTAEPTSVWVYIVGAVIAALPGLIAALVAGIIAIRKSDADNEAMLLRLRESDNKLETVRVEAVEAKQEVKRVETQQIAGHAENKAKIAAVEVKADGINERIADVNLLAGKAIGANEERARGDIRDLAEQKRTDAVNGSPSPDVKPDIHIDAEDVTVNKAAKKS